MNSNPAGDQVDGACLELLTNILPVNIIDRIQQGQNLIADSHDHVCILFSDIVGFTTLASRLAISEVFFLLSNMFISFDRLLDGFGVYKVETIGKRVPG